MLSLEKTVLLSEVCLGSELITLDRSNPYKTLQSPEYLARFASSTAPRYLFTVMHA
jgi:hypothetical protein